MLIVFHCPFTMNCKVPCCHSNDVVAPPSCRLQKKEAELVEMSEENKQLKQKSNDLETQIDTLEERVDQLLDQTVVRLANVTLMRGHVISYYRNRKKRTNK